jgi:hypothetical protein
MRQHLSLAAAAVDHPRSRSRGGLDQPPLAGQVVEQGREQLSGLASAEAAQDRARTHLSRHTRDPHALAARVDVDVVPAGPATLDRDTEDGVRSEDGDAWLLHAARS